MCVFSLIWIGFKFCTHNKHIGKQHFFPHTCLNTSTYINNDLFFFSCPGRIFSYCVRARAYTHVLARVYSTRASTCTIYTCFTLPPTRVNPTGLQLSIFQQFWSFVTNIRTSMLPNKFYGRAQPNWDNFDFDFDNCGSYFWKSWPCLICLQFIYLQTDHVMPPSLDFERE